MLANTEVIQVIFYSPIFREVDVTVILVPPFSGGCEVEVAGDSSARCAIGLDLAGENWSPNSTYTWQSFGGRLSVDSTFLGSAHGRDLAGRSDHADKASKKQWTINIKHVVAPQKSEMMNDGVSVVVKINNNYPH